MSRPAIDQFVTTRWTVVLAAGGAKTLQSHAALQELCQTYWYPLYAYIRRQGRSHEDAEDLTQGFFARFLEKDYLQSLSSDKGRFRAFLIAALKNFLANERDRVLAQKRGGDVPHIPIDGPDAATRFEKICPMDDLSPDKLYDRAWAVTLLERVVFRLRNESVAEGRTALFEALKSFLMLGEVAIPYANAAKKLRMEEGAVRVVVHRLRRRYRVILRDEICQTLSDPGQADEEMRTLLLAFASG